MIRSLWVAKTGMDVNQANLDVIANNLANASTTAFKRVKTNFEDLLYQTVRGSGSQTSEQTQAPTGLQFGAGSKISGTSRILTQGATLRTQNPLDVAISGNGYFQVNLPTGVVAYTRDGNFNKDNQGQLVTAQGYVVAPGITIPAEATGITISDFGQVSVTLNGQAQSQQVGQLQLVNFVNAAGLEAIGGNLYIETSASGNPVQGNPGQNGLGSIQQYFVEQSNVSVAEELVSMIQAQRGYEVNTRVVRASDEILQRLSQV
ncbi:MAG: flagellar basal-body rod protein FlgG [Betaproteobacteria bacterium]|nr:flagellar basal-body rod protein FlgG [Betaproteobacteria bacterium]NDE53005.1 flagellar basal-body rod protein FlgG [Actinomycetota bacterium]